MMMVRAFLVIMLCGFCFAAGPAESKQPVSSPKGAEPTISNLAKAYWRLGELSVDDANALDYFIMVNDCKTYWQTRNDDFLWQKVRAATRDYLVKNAPAFPVRFTFTVPVLLGEYNFTDHSFPLVEGTGFDQVRRLQIADNPKNIPGCPTVNHYGPFAVNAVADLEFVIHLVSVPVPADTAQKFLEVKKNSNLKAEGFILLKRGAKNYRSAFVHITLDLQHYKKTFSKEGKSFHEYFGRLHTVTVTADRAGTFVLHEKNFSR